MSSSILNGAGFFFELLLLVIVHTRAIRSRRGSRCVCPVFLCLCVFLCAHTGAPLHYLLFFCLFYYIVPVILYLQKETKIARNRYLRKRTEAVKDKDY